MGEQDILAAGEPNEAIPPAAENSMRGENFMILANSKDGRELVEDLNIDALFFDPNLMDSNLEKDYLIGSLTFEELREKIKRRSSREHNFDKKCPACNFILCKYKGKKREYNKLVEFKVAFEFWIDYKPNDFLNIKKQQTTRNMSLYFGGLIPNQNFTKPEGEFGPMKKREYVLAHPDQFEFSIYFGRVPTALIRGSTQLRFLMKRISDTFKLIYDAEEKFWNIDQDTVKVKVKVCDLFTNVLKDKEEFMTLMRSRRTYV